MKRRHHASDPIEAPRPVEIRLSPLQRGGPGGTFRRSPSTKLRRRNRKPPNRSPRSSSARPTFQQPRLTLLPHAIATRRHSLSNDIRMLRPRTLRPPSSGPPSPSVLRPPILRPPSSVSPAAPPLRPPPLRPPPLCPPPSAPPPSVLRPLRPIHIGSRRKNSCGPPFSAPHAPQPCGDWVYVRRRNNRAGPSQTGQICVFLCGHLARFCQQAVDV